MQDISALCIELLITRDQKFTSTLVYEHFTQVLASIHFDPWLLSFQVS